MNITEEQASELLWEQECGEYKTVHTTTWEQDGKAQYCEVIFSTPEGKHFMFSVSRTGSPFWEYEYYCDCHEAELKVFMEHKWVVVGTTNESPIKR